VSFVNDEYGKEKFIGATLSRPAGHSRDQRAQCAMTPKINPHFTICFLSNPRQSYNGIRDCSAAPAETWTPPAGRVVSEERVPPQFVLREVVPAGCDQSDRT
jgi:hypothetical protein